MNLTRMLTLSQKNHLSAASCRRREAEVLPCPTTPRSVQRGCSQPLEGSGPSPLTGTGAAAAGAPCPALGSPALA